MMTLCFGHKLSVARGGCVALFLLSLALAEAATVWNGPDLTFTKIAADDHTLPASQDRVTTNVWITRAPTGGLINARTENGYTHNISPADTEWAFGDLTNYASLTYTPWEEMFGGKDGGGPPTLVGKNTVMHLKTDDIYVAVKIVSWTMFSGGFSYVRSTPGGAPTPTPPLLTDVSLLPPDSLRFAFTNAPGLAFTVVAASNLTTAASNWTVLGSATEAPPGKYQFTDVGALTNAATRFYRVRSP